MPVRQIYDDLMGEHSVGIIRRAINKLLELKILDHRHNPGNLQDKTWQYKLNPEVLQSLLDKNETAEVESDRPLVKSDQSYTQDQSTNIKSTEPVSENISEEAEEIIEQYEGNLKTYGIYVHSWDGADVTKNPRMQPILRAMAKIPRDRAERAIQAFLRWIRTAKNVENVYKALETALIRRWD